MLGRFAHAGNVREPSERTKLEGAPKVTRIALTRVTAHDKGGLYAEGGLRKSGTLATPPALIVTKSPPESTKELVAGGPTFLKCASRRRAVGAPSR